MNKFTKISAASLFALCLAACDKPAENVTTPPKSAEAKSAEMIAAEQQQALSDFNTLLQWKQVQEQKFLSVQQELEQHIATEDKEKLTQALDVFNASVGEIVKELDTLEIKSPEINAFKQVAHENLTLLKGLIVESVKAIQDPKPELQAVIQEKTESLKQSTLKLKQMQTELENKYLPKQ